MEPVKATFFTDPWLMLLAGSLFAAVAGAEGQSIFRRKTYWYGFVVAIVITAAAIIFYIINPEWMMLYIIRWSEVPKWLGWSLFVLYPVPYTASYLVGLELRKAFRGGDKAWVAITAICAVVIHVLIMSYWTTWTTTAEYQAGMRGNFFSTPLWIYLGIATLISVVATLGLLFISWRDADQTK